MRRDVVALGVHIDATADLLCGLSSLSCRPCDRPGWGETFGDDIVAIATIDRLVHHAEIIALKVVMI